MTKRTAPKALIIVACLAAVALLSVTAWFVVTDLPEDAYRVYGVRITCEQGVGEDCPNAGSWRAFADVEIGRFVDAGFGDAERWQRYLRGLRWKYVPERIDYGETGSNALTFPGRNSIVWSRHALSPGTDGHELRLQLAHAYLTSRGNPRLSEWTRMQWMRDHDIYSYPERLGPLEGHIR